jgi:hypothetical protein
VHPLVPPVLVWLARKIRSSPIPIFAQRADSRVSPPAPVEAKGGPLSLRIARGSPCSRNSRSISASTAALTGATISSPSR